MRPPWMSLVASILLPAFGVPVLRAQSPSLAESPGHRSASGTTLVSSHGLDGQETGGTTTKKTHNPTEQAAFSSAAEGDWRSVFCDSCTGDWREKWFLDGAVGKVTTGPEGMTLAAGPEFKNDGHHMVLWTKQEFDGDLKIEYSYTRLDQENRCATMLYIQASGSGKGEFHRDITRWNDLRKTPAMRSYYDTMNLYHLSYAAFGNTGESVESYIRARRYLPHKAGLKGTDLKPDYFSRTLFAPGVRHAITIIKKDRELFMRIEGPDEICFCHMPNPDLPPVTGGRIGLRHMFTRAARYEDFVVSNPVERAKSAVKP